MRSIKSVTILNRDYNFTSNFARHPLVRIGKSLPLRAHGFTHDFLVGSVLLIFFVFCVVVFLLSSLFVLCQRLTVSLDCPFLIVPLAFSNVYIIQLWQHFRIWPFRTIEISDQKQMQVLISYTNDRANNSLNETILLIF